MGEKEEISGDGERNVELKEGKDRSEAITQCDVVRFERDSPDGEHGGKVSGVA